MKKQHDEDAMMKNDDDVNNIFSSLKKIGIIVFDEERAEGTLLLDNWELEQILNSCPLLYADIIKDAIGLLEREYDKGLAMCKLLYDGKGFDELKNEEIPL